MPYPAPPHRKDPPQISDEQIARGTILRCSLGLDRELAGLSTANKNRVLLALHAQIGEQLDSLAANNDQ
jgi:hypothetical protein